MIRVEEAAGCYGWDDPKNFRSLFQWIAEIYHYTCVYSNIDVDDVLADVEVDFVHVDGHVVNVYAHHGGYDGWVMSWSRKF